MFKYKSLISDMYIVRKAIYRENPDYSEEPEVEFKTGKKSMYHLKQ